MKLLLVVGIAVLLVVSTEGQSCKRTAKCPCGSFCVTERGNLPCERGPRPCVCKKGCQVGDIFIPAGETKETFCNTCDCPRRSGKAKGIPSCTRSAWCIPKGLELYPKNPNCPKKG